MPELPEAETIARTLAPHLEGRRIVEARFFSTRVHRGSPPQLAGRRVRRVGRYGKQVLLELDLTEQQASAVINAVRSLKQASEHGVS